MISSNFYFGHMVKVDDDVRASTRLKTDCTAINIVDIATTDPIENEMYEYLLYFSTK